MDDFFERMKKYMPFVTILGVFGTLAISLGVIVYNSAQSDAELLYSYREMVRELKIVSESQKAIDKRLDGIEDRLDGIETANREIRNDIKEMKTDIEGMQTDIKGIQNIQTQILVEQGKQSTVQEQFEDDLTELKQNVELNSDTVAEHSFKLNGLSSSATE